MEIYSQTVGNILIAHICSEKNKDSFDCPICYGHFGENERITNSCGHKVCHICMMTYLKTQQQSTTDNKPCCSICRHPMILLDTSNETIYTDFSVYIGSVQNQNIPVQKRRMRRPNLVRIYPSGETTSNNSIGESYDSGRFVIRRNRRIFTL